MVIKPVGQPPDTTAGDEVSFISSAWWGEPFPALAGDGPLAEIGGLTLKIVDLVRLEADLAADQAGRLTAGLLADEEAATLAGLRLPKRRREWLGGRVAAKEAARTLMTRLGLAVPAWPGLLVRADEDGRPRLWMAADDRPAWPAISISHSGDYAGALAAHGVDCGLDIQRVTPRVMRVGERFLSGAETALLAASPCLVGLDPAVRLCLAWAAKEAARKAIRLPAPVGFLELTLTGLDRDHLWWSGQLSGPGGMALPPLLLGHQRGYVIAIFVRRN